MKVVAFNGSAGKGGNTAQLIKEVFKELEKEGIKTELVQNLNVKPCKACMACFTNKDKKCAFDDVNPYIKKMVEADAIILGSPVYFANVSSEMKALIDRAGLVAIANDRMFNRKPGCAVVAVRRAGATNTFDAINKFFFINQIIVPGSSYWNLGVGLQPGDVKNDDEVQTTMQNLGKNMAWLLKKL